MKCTGPALLFEKPTGASCPLAINLFGSYERMCLALGVKSLDEISQPPAELLAVEMPESLWGKITTALPKLKEASSLPPKKVKLRPLPGGGAKGRSGQPGHAAHTHLLAR
jgi:4-hydroxy-3-polyprenylbenzoate decarboxylase